MSTQGLCMKDAGEDLIFRSSEPTRIQHIEAQKIHPCTFHIEPTGRPAGCSTNLLVNGRDGDAVKTLTAGLSVFRIGDDGKLTFVRKYDIDVGERSCSGWE